jgi:pyruvate, orthophosphate dikinase
MDTILNLGLNDRSVEGLATQSGDERFAFDSYRRFVQMFGDVVMGVDGHLFEAALDRAKRDRGVREDVDLDAGDLRKLVETFRGIYRSETGEEFPQDPTDQLARAVEAVFGSWNTPRAVTYRRHEGIADDLGTAVNVVQMVFGNMGPASATGVAFTRNPSTGERELYGEFLVNAQGEDVVAGIRTPRPLAELEQVVPEAFTGLREAMDRLEAHYKEMQDVEFTIEQGTLYVLQTRSGKRTAQAAVRVARDLVTEGVVDRDTAIARIDPGQLDQLLHPGIDPTADYDVLATGLNASPGAAVGKAVFDADTAESRGRAGEPVILVRFETTPDDIHGVIQAQAVVTAHGGMTSHAAVVARGMGKPCVCGVESLQIDPSAKRFTVDGTTISEGDEISVDGGRGLVIRGAVKLIPPQINEDFRAITGWADEIRRLGVRANADTPEDAARAREFGAEGIGLCRTEHMFFGDERLPVMREMILASAEAGRRAALERLLPFQQSDFEGILGAMAGYPVTIRLLDPPLHEFLPSLDELGPGQERVRARVKALQEVNPMLGTRGCRLGLLYPEIYEMQVRAIVRAALAVEGARVEIMHPLIAFAEELRRLRELTEAVIAEEGGDGLEILIGSMIEVPRAALLADRIARHADFFSFGTNDLTQTALAFSRDDAEGKFLTQYLEDGVISRNPFETMDDSVRDLVTIATAKARSVRPGIKLGICGEHGGDPDSIAFCNRAGLDYVSCSPFRVPIARLASAQAVLADGDRPAG